MDSFGDRNALLHILEEIYNREKSERKTSQIGQIDIFSLNNGDNNTKYEIQKTPLPSDITTENSQALQWEKELLGLYFSSHPLDCLEDFFQDRNVIPLAEALDIKKNNDNMILGVMVTKVRKITTKKGEVMAFLTIEDKTARTDAIVFPRVYQELKGTLQENKPMLLVGRLNIRDGEKSVIVQKAKYVDEAKYSSKFDGITFRIKPSHTQEEITELKKYIQDSNGDTPVKIIVNNGEGNKTVVLNKKIEMNQETKKWLRKF